MLELRQGLVSAVKYKYKYKHLEREPCVGATPRACQCCLLKAIDCDSRLSNYQLISQLSAIIITFVIVLVCVFLLAVLVLVCVLALVTLVMLVAIVTSVSQTIN